MLDRLLASLTLFTRLPFWRIKNIPAQAFERATDFWPVAGWITGGAMAITVWSTMYIVPVSIAVILAIIVRLLLTGAFHEDGLGDLFDGFGGGRDAEGILRIMKDSRTGSYGVVGMIIYYLLLFNTLILIPPTILSIALVVGDPLCKALTAQLTNLLPYARNIEESKTHTVYNRMGIGSFVICAITGLLPAIILLPTMYFAAFSLSIIIFAILVYMMKNKLSGYTGDCCGATFLLTELGFYMGVMVISILQTKGCI
ncbi:adenosylcobinamide-GDP ribazoletransferase [Porphyromonas pogonae]|uniref:adenosylcobinamide-GDP ribazoletransferase n=1 Tax=Porphyromonas pogonae TaxID=867595 RepID=UPI002E77D6E7|nr:adenosylcobinamide-GDP ribazoletransferase [Porphyromonas pogonae]